MQLAQLDTAHIQRRHIKAMRVALALKPGQQFAFAINRAALALSLDGRIGLQTEMKLKPGRRLRREGLYLRQSAQIAHIIEPFDLVPFGSGLRLHQRFGIGLARRFFDSIQNPLIGRQLRREGVHQRAMEFIAVTKITPRRAMPQVDPQLRQKHGQASGSQAGLHTQDLHR